MARVFFLRYNLGIYCAQHASDVAWQLSPAEFVLMAQLLGVLCKVCVVQSPRFVHQTALTLRMGHLALSIPLAIVSGP
jgi:hypothetical protein